MLNRRPKRRYLSVMHAGPASDAVNAIVKRCSELFGSIATEKAAIRLVKSEGNARRPEVGLLLFWELHWVLLVYP